jgi:hypothetical protein
VPTDDQVAAALHVRGRWLDQLEMLVGDRQLALAFDLLGGGPCEMAETTAAPPDGPDLTFEECRWVFDRIAHGTQLMMRVRSSDAVGQRRDLGLAELRQQVETTRDPRTRAKLEEHLEALEAARPAGQLPTPEPHQEALIARVQSVDEELAAQDERLKALRDRLKEAVQEPEDPAIRDGQ